MKLQRLIILGVCALLIALTALSAGAEETPQSQVQQPTEAVQSTEAQTVATEPATQAKPKTPAKKKNPMKVKAKKLMFSSDYLKTDKIKYEFFEVKKAKGKVTYKKLSGSKKFTIAKKSGKVTIKKKTKAGTYKLRFRIKAAGNSKYSSKTVIKKITVKII